MFVLLEHVSAKKTDRNAAYNTLKISLTGSGEKMLDVCGSSVLSEHACEESEGFLQEESEK